MSFRDAKTHATIRKEWPLLEKNTVSMRGKNILGLEDFSPEEIRLVLETAKEMKNIIHRDIKKVPTLRGKSIVTLFYEPSTRTRT